MPPLSDSPLLDTAIAGAGIIGASIAWALARKGHSVALIDSATFGGEASWAGAGMLVPGSEYDKPCPEFDFALHSLSLYPAFVAELQHESDAIIDFSLCGSLELAGDRLEMDLLENRARIHREIGIKARPLSVAEVLQRVPSLTGPCEGAILYSGAGQVDPRTIMRALRAALLQRGARLIENSAVSAVHVESSYVGLELGAERIRARRAVIAAGAWSSQITVAGTELPRAFPIKGHLLGYALASSSLAHILRYHHTYIVQRQTGYTIAGTSEEHSGFDRTIAPEVAAEIAARAHRLAGGLLPPTAQDVWTGFRPASDSPAPYLARIPALPVWLAYGHYRNGILLAPASAEKIATEISASLETD